MGALTQRSDGAVGHVVASSEHVEREAVLPNNRWESSETGIGVQHGDFPGGWIAIGSKDVIGIERHPRVVEQCRILKDVPHARPRRTASVSCVRFTCMRQ